VTYSISWVDVFGRAPLAGNPVAVVHDTTGLDDDQLAAFARWTNLSETTFLLPPEDERADYRLRIFTPGGELPFAGHPTLGSAHAWLERGGTPSSSDLVVQECGIGLVEVQRAAGDGSLSFAAPDFLRFGEVDEQTLDRAVASLGLEPGQVVRASWIDNGPGWLGFQLESAEEVLGLLPDFAAMRGLEIGVLGHHCEQDRERIGADYEVRAFCPGLSIPEDPVTGSLNAGFARWLTAAGHLPADYVARQGTALGRDGRVHVTTHPSGEIWVGGSARTLVAGSLNL